MYIEKQRSNQIMAPCVQLLNRQLLKKAAQIHVYIDTAMIEHLSGHIFIIFEQP